MNQSRVISLREYKAERELRARQTRSGGKLPNADRVWELMDRNISVAFWKKEI